MKTNKLWTILLFTVMLTIVTACDDDDNPNNGHWYDSVPEGGTFERGNTLRFYYIDDKGNSLINPEEPTTLPMRCMENTGKLLDPPADYKEGFYNGNCDIVRYDEEEKLYYFSTTACGDQKYSTSTFYIHFKGEYDKMDVTYKYTDKDVIGAKWYAKIVSWKLNDKHVYSDDDGSEKKVFIRKANGKTTISIDKK